MKKNKLFAVLAAATLLVGTGSTVLPNNNAVAQAATKKKTSAKKATPLKRYPVTFKRKPKTYYQAVEVKSNGQTYQKIVKYKNKNLKFKKGSKTSVFFSLTVNSGAKYYFLGTFTSKTSKTHSVYVSSKDLSIKNRKKIPNYGKKATAQKPQNQQVTVNIPKYTKVWKGTINKDTDQIVTIQDNNGTSTIAQYKDANGNPVTWNKGKEVTIYATEDLQATNKQDPSKKQTIKTYMILVPNGDKNQILFIPTDYVDLEDKNAQVSTMSQFNTDYEAYQKNVQNIIDQAKADAQKQAQAAKKKTTRKSTNKTSKKTSKKKVTKKTSKKKVKKSKKTAKKAATK